MAKLLGIILMVHINLMGQNYIDLQRGDETMRLIERTKASVLIVSNGETNTLPGKIQFYRQRYYNQGWIETANTTTSTTALTYIEEKEYKPVQTYFPAAVAAQKAQLAEARAMAAQQAASRRQQMVEMQQRAFAARNKHAIISQWKERETDKIAYNILKNPTQ